MVKIDSKLSDGGTTIFTVMSALAKQHGAINLSQGFPDFDCPEELVRLVQKYVADEKNQYAPMAGLPELRQAIAAKVNRSYHCSIDADEVTVTAGATQALFTAINAFIGVGDEVIVFEPAYDSYIPSVLIAGGKPVPYTMTAPDFKIDWTAVEDMITPKTKMIIINSPHNPTGSILSGTDLAALDALTKNSNILILSDEVYEHLIYDGAAHESILRYPSLYERGLAVFSFGKTFHSTGWKMGYCIGPDYLMKEFRKIHQWNVFCVNSFLQYALAEYLADESHYNYLAQFYQKKRDFLAHALVGSKFKPLDCKGTYFQLYDYSQISTDDDVSFSRKLTTDHGVAVIPVSVFYSDHIQDTIVRFCFAKNESTLNSAAEKLILL